MYLTLNNTYLLPAVGFDFAPGGVNVVRLEYLLSIILKSKVVIIQSRDYIIKETNL